jgi:hypothetical protein
MIIDQWACAFPKLLFKKFNSFKNRTYIHMHHLSHSTELV